MILIIAPPFLSSQAHAQSYNPGVSPGQSVTFGQISVTWNGAGTPPSNLQQLNQTQSITNLVTAVDSVAKSVTATQTYTYKNGTVRSQTLSGNVQSGQGNLSIWFTAGGLSAGDPVTQSSSGFLGPISETVIRLYAGTIRPVNVAVSNATLGPSSQSTYLAYDWDQSTGFLLELTEKFSTTIPAQNYSMHAKVTATNVWSASSNPDFIFDAVPRTQPLAYLGQSIMFNLNLTSFNSFQGTVNLASSFVNSSLSNPPVLSLSQNSLYVPTGGSATSVLTFSSYASTPLGLYLFKATGTNNTLSHDALFAIKVVPPDFEVFTTPSNLTIQPGTAKASTITVEALGLFSGAVGLNTATDSFLIQASLNRFSVSLSSSVTIVNSTVTVSVNSYAIPGDHGVTVTGTSGSLVHGSIIPVTVLGPDFQLSINPTTVTMSQGSTATATIGLKSLNGFTGTVSLSGSFYGALALIINPSSVALASGGSGQSTMTVSVPSTTPPGFYFGTVTGSGGLVSHSTYLSVTVTGPDFSITANPSSLSLPPGKNATSTISVTSLSGFSGNVVLGCYIGDSLGWALNSTSLTLTPGATVTAKLTVSVPASMSSSSAFIDVSGVSGNLTHSVNVSINIPQPPIPPAGPSFDVSALPLFFNIPPGGNNNSTITITSFNGFKGTIRLSTTLFDYQGACPGPTCPIVTLAQTVLALSGSGINTTTLTMAPLTSSPSGYYLVDVSATNGTLTRKVTVEVKVNVADYGVFVNVQSITLPDSGGSAFPTAVVSSVRGFTGNVTLSTVITGPVGVCPGVNCPSITLNPTGFSVPANGRVSAQLTITTTSSTSRGSYNVIVTATSGSQTRATNFWIYSGTRDFAINGVPTTLVLAPGTSGKFYAFLSSQNGFNGNITLTTVTTSGLIVTPNTKNVSLSSGGYATALFSVSVPASTADGIYGLVFQAANRTLTHSWFANVIVAAPDFGLLVTPVVNIVLTGSSGNSNITLTSLDGLRGNVSLAMPSITGSSCPGSACPTLSLIKSTVPLTPGSSGISSLTITVPASAAPGFYTILVTAINGSISHSFSAYVDVVGHSSTSVSCNSPILDGTWSLCTVTVTNTSPNSFAPAGTVTISGNYTETFNGPCNLSPVSSTSSSCVVAFAPTVTGGHRILAEYGGDGTHGPSSASTAVAATIRASSTSVVCTNPVVIAQGSTCTVTVTDTSGYGAITPTGTVNLVEIGPTGSWSTDNPCTLSGYGNSASCSATFTPSTTGSATINVNYGGDQAHTGSSGGTSMTVNKRASNVALACTSPIIIGQASTCAANVIDVSPGTTSTTTGTVSFSLTGTGSLSATACTLSSGSCSINYTATATGTATVTGSYAGDPTHSGSTSTGFSIGVNGPDFSLNTNPSTLTITQGSSGSSTISLTPQYGFNGPVSLSASSVNGMTISFSPGSISSPQNSTMRVMVSNTVPAGSYAINVTGTSGSLTHKKTVMVTVSSSSGSQSPQSILGLPTVMFYILTGGMIATLTGIAIVLTKRKKKSSSGQEVQPSTPSAASGP